MSHKFTKIDVLKKLLPEQTPFFTQSWVYSAIVTWYSQQNKFDQLQFTDDLGSLIICDYRQQPQHTDFNYYGLVFEGHVDYWAKIEQFKNCIFISGHEHYQTYQNNIVSIGFDYWDISTFQEFILPNWWYEINRESVNTATYDIVIATGSPRPHRLNFLSILEKQKKDLKIVTDARQNILQTPLRFDSLGIEVFLNKFGINQYKSYTGYESFFDTNKNRSIDHLPHKLMHQIAKVNVILETTINNVQQPYLTEKTFKVLAHHRPFVIYGDVNSLHKLKLQGFKTFDKFCDESYDQEPDSDIRCIKIINAIHQLVDACTQFPDEIDQICAHNQVLFFDQQRHADNLAKFGKLCLDTLVI